MPAHHQSTVRPRIDRCVLLVAVALFALVRPIAAEAAGTVTLGEGVVLAYNTGALDPATLAGAVEGVTVIVDGEPVATAARLTLATRGELADAGFAVMRFEAGDIATIDGSARLARAEGRDLPLGALRAFARDMEAMENPDFATVTERLGAIAIGSLTLTGLEGEDQRAHLKVARVATEGGGEGRVASIEIADLALTDKEANVVIKLASAQLAGLSFKTRTAAGFALDGFSISGSMLDVAMAAVRYTADMKEMEGGIPYSAHSSLTVTDLMIKPGLAPDPELADFFDAIGSDGVKLQIEGGSDGAPQGGNLDLGSHFKATAQTGDAIAVASRAQIPVVVWQMLNETMAHDPTKVDPEGMMQMMASVALADLDISLTAGQVADRLVEAAARDSGMTPADLRAAIADEAEGALGALPGGGAAVRDAILGFIARSGTLRLTVKPAYPVPLSTLMAAEDQIDALWDKLNITVTHTEK